MRYSSRRQREHGDASALETDVVRFMAVVGLTLMVVFALVHALPYRATTESQTAQAAEPDPPAEDLILVPRAELDALNRASVDAERERAQAAARARLMAAQLAATRRQLADARELPPPPPEPVAEPLREPTPSPLPDETASIGAPAAPPAGTDGSFVLRFRDDEVYLDLLERGRVRSYLRVPGLDLTYEISGESSEGLAFTLVYDIGAERLYRIPDGMVPGVLLRAARDFDERVAARSDLEFLVAVSARIAEQVGHLETAGRGVWDILADESVVAGHAERP